MKNKTEIIEKLLGKPTPASYYKFPFLYHGKFYMMKGFDIIMGGMVMEITLKRVGCVKFCGIRVKMKDKKIIDDNVIDIIFSPKNSIILLKEKEAA